MDRPDTYRSPVEEEVARRVRQAGEAAASLAAPITAGELANSPAAPHSRRLPSLQVAILAAVAVAVIVGLAVPAYLRGSSRPQVAAAQWPGLASWRIVAPSSGSSLQEIPPFESFLENPLTGEAGPVLDPLPELTSQSLPWIAVGSYLVGVVGPQNNFGSDDNGTAYAWQPGSSAAAIGLGPATVVGPGPNARSVFIVTRAVGSCSLREQSILGATLGRTVGFPCSDTVRGFVSTGLVLLPRSGRTLEIFNYFADRVVRTLASLTGFQFLSAGGQFVVGEQVAPGRSRPEATLDVTDVVTGTTRRFDVPSSLTPTMTATSVSPDGRLVAYLQWNGPCISRCDGPRSETVTIRLFRIGNASEKPLERELPVSPMAFGIEPQWSGDGRYLFLARTSSEIEAVPTWSTTTAAHTVSVPEVDSLPFIVVAASESAPIPVCVSSTTPSVRPTDTPTTSSAGGASAPTTTVLGGPSRTASVTTSTASVTTSTAAVTTTFSTTSDKSSTTTTSGTTGPTDQPSSVPPDTLTGPACLTTTELSAVQAAGEDVSAAPAGTPIGITADRAAALAPQALVNDKPPVNLQNVKVVGIGVVIVTAGGRRQPAWLVLLDPRGSHSTQNLFAVAVLGDGLPAFGRATYSPALPPLPVW